MNFNNLKSKITILFLAFLFTTTCAFADFSFRQITLKFAQISDTHISERAKTTYKMLDSSELLLVDAINQLNNTPNLDFLVFTGDMVDEPTEQYYTDFFKIVKESKYPVLLAFGNHDFRAVSTYDKEKNQTYLTKSGALKFLKDCNPNYPFNDTFYSFTIKKKFRIITLDLTIDETTANGKISPEQLNFLDNEIKTHPDETIVIFQHFPLLEPFPSETHKLLNADEYLSVIKQYKNPILIFSGHYHTTKIVRDENILHISSPSLVTYPNAFRVVNITDFKDRIEINLFFNETTHKEIQAESRADTMSASIFAGIEKYREKSFLIYKDRKKAKKEKKAKEL